jgi:hypothetical protein
MKTYNFVPCWGGIGWRILCPENERMHRTVWIMLGCTEPMHSLIDANITVSFECSRVEALGCLVLGFNHVLFEAFFNSFVAFPVLNQMLQISNWLFKTYRSIPIHLACRRQFTPDRSALFNCVRSNFASPNCEAIRFEMSSDLVATIWSRLVKICRFNVSSSSFCRGIRIEVGDLTM